MKLVFAHINKLKKETPAKHLFEESKTMLDLSFQYAPESDSVTHATNLSESMLGY
jgi:secreted Zn-dependent insulinase-like peptidase